MEEMKMIRTALASLFMTALFILGFMIILVIGFFAMPFYWAP